MTKRTIESEVKFEGEDGTPIKLRFYDTLVGISYQNGLVTFMSHADFERVIEEFRKFQAMQEEMAA